MRLFLPSKLLRLVLYTKPIRYEASKIDFTRNTLILQKTFMSSITTFIIIIRNTTYGSAITLPSLFSREFLLSGVRIFTCPVLFDRANMFSFGWTNVAALNKPITDIQPRTMNVVLQLSASIQAAINGGMTNALTEAPEFASVIANGRHLELK